MIDRRIAVPGMTIDQAREIVVAYGAAIECGAICDESELPFSKPAIKLAILMIAPFAPSSDEARRSLRMAYLALADFQPGVGSQRIHRIMEAPIAGEDPGARLLGLEKRLRYLERSATETQRLVRELRDSGLLGDAG